MAQETDTKTQTDMKIVAGAEPAAALPAANESLANIDTVRHVLEPKGKADAEKLLKELPTDEFLNLLDQSSPEQLQAFLSMLGPSKKVPLARQMIDMATNIPDEPRGAISIVAWWESRRMLFNTIVGLCGLPTLFIVYFFGLAHTGLIVQGTIEYGLLANICFTSGWICELIARAWWHERAKHLGPILFSLGMLFSVLLTLGAGLISIFIFICLCLIR